MTNLVSAYQKKEIREFEKILKGMYIATLGERCGVQRNSTCTPSTENHSAIMGDSFIRTYIDDVLKNIRTQVLIRLIKPYTRIEIPFISRVSRIFILPLLETVLTALHSN